MYMSTPHSPLTDNPPDEENVRSGHKHTQRHASHPQATSEKPSWVPGGFRARNKSRHKRWMSEARRAVLRQLLTVSFLLKLNLPAVKHTVLGVTDSLYVHSTRTPLTNYKDIFRTISKGLVCPLCSHKESLRGPFQNQFFKPIDGFLFSKIRNNFAATRLSSILISFLLAFNLQE